MTLQEFYAKIGGNSADVLQRLPSEAMVRKFVGKYPADTSWETLESAIDSQDWVKRKERREKEEQCKIQTNFEPGVPKKVVVMGKEYPSKTSCYADLKIQKKLVLKCMKDTNSSFEEAVIAVYQARLKKEFHFRGEVYRSFWACCKAYGVAQEYIARKAKKEGITRQEAIEKMLALREKGTL